MTQSFERIRPGPWPSNDYRVVAVLKPEPAELDRQFGFGFDTGYDDLDLYRAVALRLTSGRRLDLVRYRGNPHAGTELWADAKDDPVEALRDFMRSFAFGADDVAWTADGVDVAATGLARQPA